MNKFAKGSLAAGAGLVLLLGGAGTLAYWNDSAELTGGTINAGTLDLTAVEGTWAQGATPISDVSQWKLVPGDELTYTANLGLLAQGDNIQGTVTLDESFVEITGGDDQIDVSFDVAEGGTLPAGVTYADETFTFTQPTGESAVEIPIEVTVSFPFDTAAQQNASQGAVVNLETISFVATQTPASGAVTT